MTTMSTDALFTHTPGWLAGGDADTLLATLSTDLDWQQRELMIYGKPVRTPRLTCWVGPAEYRFSGGTEPAHAWHPALAALRDRLAADLGQPFNSVMANLYRDGSDSIAAHKDDEPQLGERPVIASVNLGSMRDFVVKHETTGERRVFPLDHGDLVVMAGRSQTDWTHAVPKRARVTQPRINLTFRVWRTQQ